MEGSINLDVNALADQIGEGTAGLADKIGEGAAQVVEALTPAASQVAESIGTTLPHLWTYGVVWQRAEGVAGLLASALYVALGSISLALVYKLTSRHWRGWEESVQALVFVFVFIPLMGVICVTFMPLFMTFKSDLMHIIAPEAMLILEIIEQARVLTGK